MARGLTRQSLSGEEMSHRQPRAMHPAMRPGLRNIKSIVARAFVGISLLSTVSADVRAEGVKRLDVLELFTSQGCSSCPPADALLGKLSKTNDVLALTFPVNYWDHLGWRDTLAKEAFTKRQYAYAHIRGDRQIYTPQLVVNGMTHVVGSQQPEIEAARKSTATALAPIAVPMTITERGGKFLIEAGPAPQGSKQRSGKIWAVFYKSSVVVEIGRGENNGRNVTYTNVVRTLSPAGIWSGEPASLSLEIPTESSFDGVAALLQADDSGAMLGVAAIPFPSQ
jgi:hypothetical protein